jgi:hypothetical protein
MLNGFILATVAEAIQEVVDYFLVILVSMDKSISIVCTSSGEGRWGSICVTAINTMACEVRVQNIKSLLFISHVDHSKGCSSIEAIPVSGLSSPRKVVSQEGVISCISIHDTICPEGSTMQNRTLLRDLFLNLLQNKHVAMIVLLQELEVETVADFTGENAHQLLETFGLLRVPLFSMEILHDFLSEALTLVI